MFTSLLRLLGLSKQKPHTIPSWMDDSYHQTTPQEQLRQFGSFLPAMTEEEHDAHLAEMAKNQEELAYILKNKPQKPGKPNGVYTHHHWHHGVDETRQAA